MSTNESDRQVSSRRSTRRVVRCALGSWMLVMGVLVGQVWLYSGGGGLGGPARWGWWSVRAGNVTIVMGDDKAVVEHATAVLRAESDQRGWGERPPKSCDGLIAWTWRAGENGHEFTLPLWPLVMGLWVGGLACLLLGPGRGPGSRRLIAGWTAAPLGAMGVVLWAASGWRTVALNAAPLWLHGSSGTVLAWWQSNGEVARRSEDDLVRRFAQRGNGDVIEIGEGRGLCGSGAGRWRCAGMGTRRCRGRWSLCRCWCAARRCSGAGGRRVGGGKGGRAGGAGMT